ncbi:MAG: hypothetical protein M3292_06140 [Actinomycetota bacterium]|nr:hypothetical protein [Actinomycetota bacterium]
MDRSERLADNERRIREINEDLDLVAHDTHEWASDLDTSEVEFLCACGRPDCDETILLSLREYEATHREPHRFVVVPGHETPPVERVIEKHPTYLIVEKRPEFQARD